MVPQGELRAAALKAELAHRMQHLSDTGTVVNTTALYGDCLASEAEDAAAARDAARAKRSRHA